MFVQNIKKHFSLYMLLLPGLAFYIIFKYVPIVGYLMAFQDFKIGKGLFGSPWIGLDNFRFMFQDNNFVNALNNTLIISVYKLIFGTVGPIILALLLNEVISTKFKKVIQTISYLPHFISWVIIAGILTGILSSKGIINYVLVEMLHQDKIIFLADPNYFRSIMVITEVWKNLGWGTIIYLAAISGIDTEMYEAAIVDGCSRFKQALYITLPCMIPTIIILLILHLGGILNAGFEQIYLFYTPPVYPVADILDTLALRIGIQNNFNYGVATAITIFKSVVGLLLIIAVNKIVKYVDKDHGIW
ncbi:ABC transporter permease [Paenibacillus radicis (ex Xue et al. 2023)]|uniref:ABC transporter permease subunit n=1 Tax=Paenibacillus radicis (ex Xue et al. 2023) TaxID=2972489 RepID=A0ABT1YG22_9BACL|nr:ABC transporter permease subunit [Paenibacillus radicis (ex Xue et al. 2023)]MCR8632141.1 ABC transporter permease subunit [Paenibacillus radicis (ex Xue et al. 2023)]